MEGKHIFAFSLLRDVSLARGCRVAGALLAILLACATMPAAHAQRQGNAASAEDSGDDNYDAEAEAHLLALVNRERVKAGEGPLQTDAGLIKAAREHATAMAAAHQLSHQLKDEPALAQRLAAATDLHMEGEGENVAVDVDLQQAHDGLMESPGHRANILNPAFNYVGMAVLWDDGHLWIVQDFAKGLPSYTDQEAENLVSDAVNRRREEAKLPALRRAKLAWLKDVACAMRKEDKLNSRAGEGLSHQYSVITYTQTNPAVLFDSKFLVKRDIASFSVAACYGKTQSYPTGVYWIVLLLY